MSARPMNRRRLRFWLPALPAWWLGLIAGRVTMDLDLDWWGTVVGVLLAVFTWWVAWLAMRADDREESAR